MLKQVQREQSSDETLAMPEQKLHSAFVDLEAPGLAGRHVPKLQRAILLGLPLVFSGVVAAILATAFQHDGLLTATEFILVALMALLAGWEAIPSANAIIGLVATKKSYPSASTTRLTVAILATIRDENANEVIAGKLNLLRSLQHYSGHSFSLHILSDSSQAAHVQEEQRLVWAAFSTAVFYHHRTRNTDFKSGNIRSWINQHGGAYEAFIILDADSELDHRTAVTLADALAADPTCGLIQTVPRVLPGNTHWQHMQSIASRHYGGLQGLGLAAWMGDEANYYGHNAIIRTKAFAACAGLPHLKGWGFWNGTILSHDFVEAALMRRSGWAVQLLPATAGSFEQAPKDIIAHLKRDARWCLGNFQHSRILRSAGLHTVSRLHLISGIFTYLTSAIWLVTVLLWAILDNTRTGIGGALATLAMVFMIANLLLPRMLGTLHVLWLKPNYRWSGGKSVIAETLFSSFIAPSMMLQRVIIICGVLANQKMDWAPLQKSKRNLLNYLSFHWLELVLGLGLLASIERGYLTSWFLPLALCLALTPLLSWTVGRPTRQRSHEELNEATPL
jgi:membrane glycosyltransferase